MVLIIADKKYSALIYYIQSLKKIQAPIAGQIGKSKRKKGSPSITL